MRIASIIDLSTVDVPGVPATVIFTGGCNFDCPYCQNANLIPLNSGVITPIPEIVSKVKDSLSEGFCLTGGEPTIHKDLPKLLEALRTLTPRHINLNTQGSIPAVLKSSIPYLDSVWFDIKAAPEKYQSVTRTRIDPWPQVRRSFDLLLDSDVLLWPRTTYVGGLLAPDDIIQILDFLAEIGFQGEYHLQNYICSENVRKKDAEFFFSPPITEVKEILKIAPKGISIHFDWR